MESNPPPKLETLAEELAVLISQRLLEVPPTFATSSNLFELGLDSMAIMQLLLLIDEKYGLWLQPSDLTRENFNTPLTVAQLLHSRLGVPPSK
ncbi:MAG: acyl carrier protein [Verrucomicrobia bacterium]|nr:acyl carrier protein [Verrucomicrobiota bacterium]